MKIYKIARYCNLKIERSYCLIIVLKNYSRSILVKTMFEKEYYKNKGFMKGLGQYHGV